MVLLGDSGQEKTRKPQTSQQTKLPGLFGRHTSPRQKLLGITFPNHSEVPAHPSVLVAMVRDDGAPDGYNTRQRAGKGFCRGRREESSWEEGKALPACGHAAPQHRQEVSGCPGPGRALQWVHVLHCSSCKNG